MFLVVCWNDKNGTACQEQVCQPVKLGISNSFPFKFDYFVNSHFCWKTLVLATLHFEMLTLMLFETSSFFFLQRARVLLQTKTLIKTLSFFTSRPLSIYILNNDNAIFQATILNYNYKCTKIKGFKVQEKHLNTI